MNRFLQLLRECRKFGWYMSPLTGDFRAICPNTNERMCPVEAVLYLTTGRHKLNYGDMQNESKTLGLYQYQVHNIIRASDGAGGGELELRMAIIKATGVGVMR